MPIQLLEDIITDGAIYPKTGRIGTLVQQINKLIALYTEADIYKLLNSPSMKETLDKAIEACKDNFQESSNPLISITISPLLLLTKLTELKDVINSPAKYFESLVNDGSDQFHALNVPLQEVLFTTEPTIKSTISISDPIKGRYNINGLDTLNKRVGEKFHEIQNMMEYATNMLANPELKKDENIKYLEGRITRRLKEMPISENLLKIRTQMNKLTDSKSNDITSLKETVKKAADAWRPIYDEMIHLQESYIAKKGKEGQAFTRLDQCCLNNFGFVAARIDKAINTLDEAFKNCSKKNIIEEEDYRILSECAYSSVPYSRRPHK